MAETATVHEESAGGGFLDKIEKVGNKVPHPVIMFLYLILGVMVISAVLAAFDVSVTEEVATPVPLAKLQALQDQLGGSVVPYDLTTGQQVTLPEYTVQEQTFEVQSLLSVDGVRFMLSSFVNNFAGFAVVAVTFVAMAGVGVAEHAGMMGALIRKLVAVAPASLIGFFIIFVGVLSSVASDAGYLILIPLAATAFFTLGRHPLAGMAAAYAGVGAVFAVNVLITPVDSMLNEITNEAIGTAGEPLTITANLYFSIVSSFAMALVAVIVTQRIVEPRLGPMTPPKVTRRGWPPVAPTPDRPWPTPQTTRPRATESTMKPRPWGSSTPSGPCWSCSGSSPWPPPRPGRRCVIRSAATSSVTRRSWPA
jgi:aminobenzoyl-glutamate transport protein